MGKEKIGKDVIGKKSRGMTAKESEKFQEFLAEKEAKKKKTKKPEEPEEVEGKRLELKPPEEKEPTPDQLARERAKEMEEMHRVKEAGKSVHVEEHFRHPPGKAETEKAETAEEEEDEKEEENP